MVIQRIGFTVFFCSFWLFLVGASIASDPLPQTSRSGITPLKPPNTLVIPASEVEQIHEFADFTFDEGETESTLQVTYRNLYEYHDVYGPGRSASFLEQGGHFMSDLDVRSINFFSNGWRSELSTTGRYTQSDRYDPDRGSLQYLQLVLADEDNNHHLTLGDYYASFSQYSFNRGIKGVGYQYTINEFSYIKVAAGTFHSRWNYLFERDEMEPIDRHGGGLRVQTGGENFLIGLNLVGAWDRNDDPNRTSEVVERQVLPSVDWEYQLPMIRLSGEHAYAPTRREDGQGNKKTITGTANRINAHAYLGKVRWQLRTEHVTPEFVTMAGGAAVDRFRVYNRLDYRLSRIWSLYLGNDWYRNNLEGDLVATTKTWVPEIGFRASGLFDRRSLNLSSGVRRRIVKTESPINREQVSDRVFVSLGDRFGDMAARAEVEMLINDNKQTSPSSRQDDFYYRFILDSRHLIANGVLDLRPYLTLERQEVEDPATGMMVYTESARFDLRAITRNDLYLGGNFEWRKTRSNISDRDDSKEIRYAAHLEKRPEILGGGAIRAEAGHNRYNFTTDGRNYRENYVLFSLDLMLSKGI